jgi:hypothetical protein
MTTSVSYTPHENISEVVLVGGSGTGSQLARTLCRVVYDLRHRRRYIPALHFVDLDYQLQPLSPTYLPTRSPYGVSVFVLRKSLRA